MNPHFDVLRASPHPGASGARPRGSQVPHHDQRRLASATGPGILQPSVATNFGRHIVPSQTPLSAISAHSFGPGTPIAFNDQSPSVVALSGSSQNVSPDTPTMEPYDPRQWTGRAAVSGAQMVFHQRGGSRSTSRPTSMIGPSGNEVSLPSPPPPYSQDAIDSPAAAGRAQPMWENMAAFTSSPLVAESSSRPSPQVPMSPGFPPPPPQPSRNRDRSASGLANHLFSLPGRRSKQPVQPEPEPSQMVSPLQVVDARPPASRRAASTGHMNESTTFNRTAPAPGLASREPAWHPGMPLPGPPPGPPPPNSMRSQSLNRVPSTSSMEGREAELALEAPHRQRAAASSALGPIPPTPAHWIDSDHPPPQDPSSEVADHPPGYQPLRINTGTRIEHPPVRRSHRRDGSAAGIHERRSRSRAAKESTTDSASGSSGNSKLTEVLSPAAEGSISRRRGHARTASGFPASPSAPTATTTLLARSTSQPPDANHNDALSPPLTAGANQTGDDSLRRRSALRKPPGSASSDRPISQLLYARNTDDSGPPSMSPGRVPARPPSSSSMRNSTRLDPFFLKAMERHRSFIEKEASAASDEERLELFASFIVHESRLRRDRYATAYTALASDIVDLTRDMWRSYTKQVRRVVTPSTSTSSIEHPVPAWASDGQPTSAQGNFPSSASSFGEYTPATDFGSTGDPEDGFVRSESRQWAAEVYKPSLSPIPSMAVSTTADEDSSRGRKSSRWWEDGQSGSGSVGNPARIEKSRRETKYMGVTAAALNEDPSSSQESPDLPKHTPMPGPSSHNYAYGPDEYPPEKVGWHEPMDVETPMATPAFVRERKTSSASGASLDVSRLVTLPPPYPRHYPAINNNHPVLADMRYIHRALADQDKIREIKELYKEHDLSLQTEQQAAAKDRRRQLRASIQERLADNSFTFAEAAQAEADFDLEEAQRAKTNARSNFDVFETEVAHPLNQLLTERLQKANECIDQLRVELESRNEASDPNQAQEEGDEQPERLEQLTLLKWMFETREQLHKEMFDLHAERSAKYSDVVLTPLRVSKMQAKIDEATGFFKRDSNERQKSYAKDAAKRYEDLQRIMEAKVSRGVEDQLSAFWDIAPGLLEVIQLITPARDLSSLDIRISPQEYSENPAYADHPMQYLYTLLAHAEKSAYQFIESQTNLLCLLHEVRTANAKATLRLREFEFGEDDVAGLDAMRAQAQRRESALTADLQEKVGEVERQWREALGVAIGDCKDRVREWLDESGGWEDGLE